MTQCPKISVVIPVHNAQASLARCLDSLAAQTFKNWEAICIDDGSTDNSGTICDSYSEKDNRIIPLHQPNQGVSVARNSALAVCRGEYIMFIDSDDFLHPQTMEICLHFVEKDKSDMVAFTYNRQYRTKVTLQKILHLKERTVKFRQYDIETIESRMFNDVYSVVTEYSHPKDIDKRWAVKHCQPWRCLYRAERISGIRFEAGIIYEDFPWWGEVLLNTDRITVINLPLYYYYPSFGGYVHSSKQTYRIESLKKALDKSISIYENQPRHKRECWEKNFIAPFRAKLESKIRQHKQ